MEDVLPSRGIENATPDIPLGGDPMSSSVWLSILTDWVCQFSQKVLNSPTLEVFYPT